MRLSELSLVIVLVILSLFIPGDSTHLILENYTSQLLRRQTVLVTSVRSIHVKECTQNIGYGTLSFCGKLMVSFPPVSSGHTGSGVLVRHRGKIRALTAAHVCEVDAIPETFSHKGITVKVEQRHKIQVSGVALNNTATITKIDSDLDLCLLEFDSPPEVPPAIIAHHWPKISDRVHYAGAPNGFMSIAYTLIFDGRFAGWYFDKVIFAIPCTSGSSGSAIRNDRGEIVAILQSVNKKFHHICFGAPFTDLKKFLR
tara:strand:+ start:261 stop:1028 length:768 start_codon:yes stop_codon:yes gene_type:complete